MNAKKFSKVLLIALPLAILILAIGSLPMRGDSFRGGKTIALEPPPFVQVASAESNDEVFEIGAKLDDEAGMAGYFETSGAIDLDDVRDQFRTIEDETATYIIGSVPVPDHPEQFDVHVYVHVDGWILAYYMNSEPASKIVDVYNKTIDTTKLNTTVGALTGLAGYAFSEVTYYDFRYPNATNMLFVAEENNEGYDDFKITLPSSYAYQERSWALFDSYSHRDFVLDGTDLVDTHLWGGSNMWYGSISAPQLLPDTEHIFNLHGSGEEYGVLVITHSVP
jgi:hypothetical protein